MDVFRSECLVMMMLLSRCGLSCCDNVDALNVVEMCFFHLDHCLSSVNVFNV